MVAKFLHRRDNLKTVQEKLQKMQVGHTRHHLQDNNILAKSFKEMRQWLVSVAMEEQQEWERRAREV